LRAAALQGEAATQLLIEALGDKSPGVRYGAAQSLGERGASSADLALELLANQDKQQRVLGTIMLKHIGKQALSAVTVPALVKALRDEHFDVRQNAAVALEDLGDWAEAAVPALIEAAGDEEWWVRNAAYKALAAIDTPETRLAMIRLMTKERHAAAWFGPGWLKPSQQDPALQGKMARAYGQWLIKEEGYYNTFGARGKFNQGIGGLERLVKEKKPIPDEVAQTIRELLKEKDSPIWCALETLAKQNKPIPDEKTSNRALWDIDKKAQKRLEAILESIDADKGTK
jgi:hypothetical protein